MSQHRVCVVVGEGQSMRQGLLRFVLEGEGFEVVGEAATSAELARVLAIHQPDVVVLDDGIGATAVQMAREVAPKTKVILVWPGAVVPIGGDARVDPSEVLRDLGSAVARVAGVPIPSAEGFVRPDWVEKVRKDPAALREMLAARGGIESRRPSVTELQRRGRRLHPGAAAASAAQPDEDAAVVILPVGSSSGRPGAEPDEPVIVMPDAVAAAAATPLPDRRTRERDRKLGTMALGGAAAAGILVLALVLGGSRIEGHLQAERPNAPPPSGAVNPPNPPGGPTQPGNPNGPQAPGGGTGTSSPGGTSGATGPVGDGTSPFTRGQLGTTGGGQTAPTGGGTGGNGGGTPPPPPTAMPGRSALHNPHGGPPGHLDDGQAPGQSGQHGHAGNPPGQSGQHGHKGNPPGHSGAHGQGAAHRNPHAADHTN
jgi:hypothetical protein